MWKCKGKERNANEANETNSLAIHSTKYMKTMCIKRA